MTKSIFISHPIYQISSYGVGHPLAIPRVSLATDLVRALGWLDATNYIESRQATIAELTNFHDVGYVQSLISAETSAPSEADKVRYNIGKNKGYGTKDHLNGILEYGITQWHRKTYGRCKESKMNTL